MALFLPGISPLFFLRAASRNTHVKARVLCVLAVLAGDVSQVAPCTYAKAELAGAIRGRGSRKRVG
jgi:hypothetical protein